MRAIIQSFVLPTQKLKKTAEEAEAQYKSRYYYFYKSLLLHLRPTTFVLINSLHSRSCPRTDRDTHGSTLGRLQVLWYLLRMGEESAKFIHHELETTWGSSHLAVLDKQEAQKWLLGVGVFTYSPFTLALTELLACLPLSMS